MTWIQFAIFIAALVITIGVGFEITYRRLKKLILIRGHHEDALAALTGRLEQEIGARKSLDGRVEFIEKHFGFRATS